MGQLNANQILSCELQNLRHGKGSALKEDDAERVEQQIRGSRLSLNTVRLPKEGP